MKKTLFLFFLATVLIISGCNEKNLIGQIVGTWHLQKYAVSGVDHTLSYDTTHAAFTWTFADGDLSKQTWQSIRVFTLQTFDTIAHYDTTAHAFIIDSITMSIAKIPTGYTTVVGGKWYLTNGNSFLETIDSVNGTLLYQIVDHSKSSLHLLYGNQDFYLSK